MLASLPGSVSGARLPLGRLSACLLVEGTLDSVLKELRRFFLLAASWAALYCSSATSVNNQPTLTSSRLLLVPLFEHQAPRGAFSAPQRRRDPGSWPAYFSAAPDVSLKSCLLGRSARRLTFARGQGECDTASQAGDFVCCPAAQVPLSSIRSRRLRGPSGPSASRHSSATAARPTPFQSAKPRKNIQLVTLMSRSWNSLAWLAAAFAHPTVRHH